MLPNLIVIGAGRCGTTSLHAYLDLHPEISMSQPKELSFFIDRWNWSRGRGWYESHFRDATRIRGESTPAYTAYPHFPHVPERMAELVPDAQLVYVVRDPVERALSEWALRVHYDDESRAPAEALGPPYADSWYVARSRYWLQLERYLRVFPAERIHVVDFDDLVADTSATLRGIFAFLGVDPSFDSPGFEHRHNESKPLWRRNGAGDAAVRALDSLLGRDRSSRLRRRGPQLLQRPFKTRLRPELPDAARDALREYLAPEVERLRHHTGLAFAGWSL